MKTLTTSILMLLFVSFAVSQVEDELTRQEREERERAVIENAQQVMSPTPASFISLFLPDSENSWTISISKTGGIMGHSGRVVAAMNSEGFYACDENGTKNLDLNGISFLDDITDILSNSTVPQLKKQFDSVASFCNDCVVTSMQITAKRKDKVSTSVFRWSILGESNAELLTIYKSVLSSTGCRN